MSITWYPDLKRHVNWPGKGHPPEAYIQELRDHKRAVEKWERVKKKLRPQVFERDGYTCLECGSTEKLVADHILSMRRGGDSTLDNLQTLCWSCNARKATTTDRVLQSAWIADHADHE